MHQEQHPMHRAIIKMMHEETTRIVNEEAELAAKRVNDRVRELAGSIATRLASHVSYETGMNHLRIIVQLPPTNT